MSQETPAPPTGRLLSIDALRGFDMLWIVGGDALVHAWARWSGTPFAARVDAQFEHVEWEGFRFYDLIFPLFLFLVGVVLPFSLGRLRERGASRGQIVNRVVRRALLLFLLGLVCNGLLQLRWPMRVAGVLQRIAIGYGLASLVALNLRPRGQFVAFAAILLGYWALLAGVAAPGGAAGDYSKSGNVAGWLDRHYLPGKILDRYYGDGDNEGLLSTIPAVATALLGVLAGEWLRSARGPWTKAAGLAVAGAASLALGHAWGLRFPIIKNLWTSSFVLVAGGWSLLLLALFYAIVDVLRFRSWAFPFAVIGANAITIYVLPRFVDFHKIADFFLGGLIRQAGDFGPVLAALGVLAAEWLFLLYLYRNRIFLRV